MKLLLPLFILSLFFSCAHRKYLDEHKTFLRGVEENKRTLSKAEYRAYLKYQLEGKQNELDGLKGLEHNSEGRLSIEENMTNNYAAMDNYRFQADSTKIDLKRIAEKKEIVEKEIFYLRSELASTEK